MKSNNLLIGLSSLAIVVIFLSGMIECRKDKIKLKDIQVLTLKPNMWTTGRRTRSVPQLNCVGGNCDAIKGQTVQCYNRGSDGVDIQWECQSNIKSGYKFGNLEVVCEGYDYPDDDYVLVGSCGLEFAIEKTADSQGSHFGQSYFQSPKGKPSQGISFIFIIGVAGIIFIIYYTCLRPNGASLGRDSSRGRAPPPPPPGFRSDFFGSNDGCSSSSTGYSGFTNDRTQTNANNGNGFFSGLLAGGTLGYLFGSRNTTNYRDQSSYFGSRANPSNYFSSSDRSSEPSTSTSTTKGFGGTKRR